MSPASKAAGAIYPFSGSKNLPLNDSKPTACLCLLKAKLLTDRSTTLVLHILTKK